MKNKKVVALVMGIAMAFSLTACGGSSDTAATAANGSTEQTESTEQTGGSADVTTFIAAHASTNESTLGQFFLTIQQYLEDDLAEMILKAEVESGSRIKVDYDKDAGKIKCSVE